MKTLGITLEQSLVERIVRMEEALQVGKILKQLQMLYTRNNSKYQSLVVMVLAGHKLNKKVVLVA